MRDVTLREDVQSLRRHVKELPGRSESIHVNRYSLRFPPAERLSVYRRLRALIGRFLRAVGLRPQPAVEPWIAALKHAQSNDTARTVLIWALDTDRDTLRRACRKLVPLFAEESDLAPVLVTNVADFAQFSRLGWLVEFVPALSSPAERYAERKLRYVAWRYRDALILPITAGLQDASRIEDLPLD